MKRSVSFALASFYETFRRKRDLGLALTREIQGGLGRSEVSWRPSCTLLRSRSVSERESSVEKKGRRVKNRVIFSPEKSGSFFAAFFPEQPGVTPGPSASPSRAWTFWMPVRRWGSRQIPDNPWSRADDQGKTIMHSSFHQIVKMCKKTCNQVWHQFLLINIPYPADAICLQRQLNFSNSHDTIDINTLFSNRN